MRFVIHGIGANREPVPDLTSVAPITLSDPERPPVSSRWLGRTPFAQVRSVDAELRQLAGLRWIAGIVCVARTVPIVYSSIDYVGAQAGGGLPDLTIAGLVVLGLTALATMGVAAPLTLPLVIHHYHAFDERMQTENLGTDVLLLLLGLFWVTGAGARWSVDSYFLRRTGWSGLPVRILYRLMRIPSRAELSRIYVLFFTAFAIMNFGAAVYHIDDPLWNSGSALRVLFTNSYLSRPWETFRRIEVRWPSLLQAFSVAATVGQMAFQIFMLPLMWLRWGRRFVITWGILFFAMSVFVLQLSYLPLLEILLWVALLRRPRHLGPGQVEPPEVWRRSRTAAYTGLAFGTAALATFALTSVPYVDNLWGSRAESIRQRFRAVGLEVPDVLNVDDLRMGDVWPVIYRREPGKDIRLPYHGPHGQRLAWVQWNDLLYFANSLKWRREYRGSRSLEHSSDSCRRLVNVALFDHRRRGAASSRYVIAYFASDASNLTVDVRKRFKRRRLGSDSITCAGTGESAACE